MTLLLAPDAFRLPSPAEPGQAAELWRGQCVALFARGEEAVWRTLRHAAAAGHTVKFEHLAGQRMNTLRELADATGGTAKQDRRLKAALDDWQKLEERRRFLAHGAASVWTGARAQWLLALDLTFARQGRPEDERWALRPEEMEAYRAALEAAFKALSRELGQLRKQLGVVGGCKGALPEVTGNTEERRTT